MFSSQVVVESDEVGVEGGGSSSSFSTVGRYLGLVSRLGLVRRGSSKTNVVGVVVASEERAPWRYNIPSSSCHQWEEREARLLGEIERGLPGNRATTVVSLEWGGVKARATKPSVEVLLKAVMGAMKDDSLGQHHVSTFFELQGGDGVTARRGLMMTVRSQSTVDTQGPHQQQQAPERVPPVKIAVEALLETKEKEEEEEDVPGDRACIVCHSAPRSVALYPCGHANLCSKCAPRLLQDDMAAGTCPTCRAGVDNIIKLYDQ